MPTSTNFSFRFITCRSEPFAFDERAIYSFMKCWDHAMLTWGLRMLHGDSDSIASPAARSAFVVKPSLVTICAITAIQVSSVRAVLLVDGFLMALVLFRSPYSEYKVYRIDLYWSDMRALGCRLRHTSVSGSLLVAMRPLHSTNEQSTVLFDVGTMPC